ncbi:MAG: carbohydrate ABC transporter permease [Vicinamibacterales bacterium]
MKSRKGVLSGAIAVVISIFVFVVPFAFIAVTAMKNVTEAGTLEFSLPKRIVLWQNLKEVIRARDHMIVRAFLNSVIITAVSVAALVVFGSMLAYVLQRRKGPWNGFINFMLLLGLIATPAVVPTIFVLQRTHVFKSLQGLMFIEIAFGLPFSVILFRAFIGAIPRDLDEAAMIDGAGPLRIFFGVIFPILRPVIVTVIVLQSVFIYNDFEKPLYFLPGDAHPTVQLTLFNFQSQFRTSYNLLFTDILLVTIPPLIMFIFFSRKIVAGMTAGAVKG